MKYEIRNTKYKLLLIKILSILLFLVAAWLPARAQSTNQNYPTAVTTNEISGTIKARDLGDARLTNYFYVFNATQGDVFINVVSNNLNGNIDIFTADGLKPLTKIIVFADVSDNETGRVVYLRKPERLILRVEGRTPNDDPAMFKIKFAGSFQALSETEKTEVPDDPKVTAAVSDARVNSVGTIIPVKPKPTEKVSGTRETEKKAVIEPKVEEPAANDAKNVVQQISVENGAEKTVIADNSVKNKNESNVEIGETNNKIDVVVTEQSSGQTEKQTAKIEQIAPPVETKTETETGSLETTKTENTPKENIPTKAKSISAKKSAKDEKIAKAAELNAALENIRLIILMKDGAKIEKPMSEILRVGVDKGVLTVIAKDGTINRYSILDVAKMSIE